MKIIDNIVAMTKEEHEEAHTVINEHSYKRLQRENKQLKAIIKEAREWFNNLLDNDCDNNDEREYFQKGLAILNKANDPHE
jgi:GAF domain-containing protein